MSRVFVVIFRCFNDLCVYFLSPAWAQAVAALMIIGLILLIIAFIVAVVAMCRVDTGAMIATAVFLAIVGKFAHGFCDLELLCFGPQERFLVLG